VRAVSRQPEELAARVEALLAKPYPTTRDMEAFCNHARLQGYRSVVVASSFVELCYDFVADDEMKVCCLVGYPFGQSEADVKRYEVELAAEAMAHEIELVPSISKLMEGKYAEVLREIRDVVEAAEERPVRVSIDSALWSEVQLGEVIRMVLDSGAQYLSTSVAPALKGPVTEAEVQKLRELVGVSFGLKIGGLKSLDAADQVLIAGADRIGLLV
jgi:deoxyribose-phosphate aldolase